MSESASGWCVLRAAVDGSDSTEGDKINVVLKERRGIGDGVVDVG